MSWRWDQGRLGYFQFNNIVNIARVLSTLDRVHLDTQEDLLRIPLMQGTGLPFAPSTYKVWRNYARVFACAMLATEINNQLVVTDLCRELARVPSTFSSDQYFDFVFSRFMLPYAAFENYNANETCTYPFVAIIKLVFSSSFRERGASLDEIFSYVVGNRCTGLEDTLFYETLQPSNYQPTDNEKRQVREMLVFMGQSSFLKWLNRRLYADTTDFDGVLAAVSPNIRNTRLAIPEEEFLATTNVGTLLEQRQLDVVLFDRLPTTGFAEGHRVFRTHSTIERSPLVRRHFFHRYPGLICDACHLDVRHKYPWTDNILELHHVLPLSATINVNGTTTLLGDMVPLCPTCHKSIHAYYRIKLTELGIEDFESRQRAREIYDMAKGEIVL